MNTRTIYDGFGALIEATRATIKSADVRYKLALARNFLKPRWEALEETRLDMVKKHNVGQAAQAESLSGDPPRFSPEMLRQVDAFNEAWKKFLDKPAEPAWTAPASFPVAHFGDKDTVTAEQIAGLLDLGVVTATVEKAKDADEEES